MSDPILVARKLASHTAVPFSALSALPSLLGATRRFDAGDIIARGDDMSEVVTFVAAGFVCRASFLADGRRQITSLLLPGDAADLETLHMERRTGALQALSRATVWFAPKVRVAAAGPSPLGEALHREAALHAELSRAWLVNLGQRQAHERMAHFFCELSYRMDAAGIQDGRGYPFPLKQEDIGDALGLSVVHVNRVLQQLRREGLVELQSRRLTLPDREGLERVAGFDPDYLGLSRRIATRPGAPMRPEAEQRSWA